MNLAELRSRLLNRCVEQDGPIEGSPCWVWTWGHSDKGYGCISWKGQVWRAHRLSYIAFVAPIPDGLDCLHHCDIRDCINPDHLYVGDDYDNQGDMYRRGRNPCRDGECNPRAVISNEQAAEVKWLALYSNLSQFQIADFYGVDQTRVSGIKLGKTYQHVEPREPLSPPIPLTTPGFIRRI